MKINKLYIKADDIDLLELLRKIYKEKVLLISVSLLFMVIGYVYGLLQPKIYKTTVLLREAPAYLYEVQPILVKQSSFTKHPYEQSSSLAKDFNNEFKIFLSSSEFLDHFLKQNNKIDEFKLSHKRKNIEIKKDLKVKIEVKADQEKNNLFQYTLTYEEYLGVDQFLNDFIYFAQQETATLFKKHMELLITKEIKKYEENLEIAKIINLENPSSFFYFSQETIQDADLFNRGAQVLTYQIANLKKMLREIKVLKLDYNPIVEKASSPTLISKSPFVLGAIFFLLGLFLSLMLIFIRFLLKNLHYLKT